ncbi:MAG: transglycosylase SLT domain-containing protein [Bacteroidetes bacterium]|nr:transglycosylase SLT domain-containing protein [Bacteroidota bacterium]
MRDLNRNMLTTAFALALFASATTALAGPDSLQQHTVVVSGTGSTLEQPLTKADWELVLDAMDSLVAELESSAFRPAEPPLDSGTWHQHDAWPKFDDATLKARLQAIPTTIPLTFNATVRSWIEMYTLRNRAGVQRMLGLRDLYFPIIEQELDKRNLPMELKYLAVIESALNTHAVSPQGATGLWQIMYPTAKGLGLRIDTYVDERRDPYAATDAGIDYLEQLYGIYGDWLLVIAAYNCGPGNVNKAIRKAGGKRNVWAIFDYLPKETRGYVPAFISAVYTFNYYKEHEFTPWKCRFSYSYSDTVMVSENTTFVTLSEQLDMSVSELRYHNPALRKDVVPGGSGHYPLRLPHDKAMLWLNKRDEILAAAREPAKPAPSPSPETEAAAAEAVPETVATEERHTSTEPARLLYTVKSGDNLTYIAGWYAVSVSDLRTWNKLSGNAIKAGQKLVVYKPANEAHRYTGLAGMSFTDKQRTAGQGVTASAAAPGSATSGTSTLLYRVKSGDTLWSIARAHPGNSIDSIAQLNGMSARSTLKAGMTLKLQK